MCDLNVSGEQVDGDGHRNADLRVPGHHQRHVDERDGRYYGVALNTSSGGSGNRPHLLGARDRHGERGRD
jgi:hypothetical protein